MTYKSLPWRHDEEIYTEAISELDAASSYSIGPDMDYGGHRRRSNTAARLEKMRKERKNLEKQKTVPWKDNKDPSQFTRTSFFVDIIIYHGDLLQPDVTENHFRGSAWL